MKHVIFSRRSTERSPKGFHHQKHRRLDRCRSARTPAHYCGAYAHKPTLNVVPPRGHTIPSITPREADLAMVGPNGAKCRMNKRLTNDGKLREKPRRQSTRRIKHSAI
jgi:hypothetical protein